MAGSNSDDSFDAVVVGAGPAGLYALYRLQRLGLTTIAYEAGAGVGGTWFWNRYPGARCDVESMEYSYSFSEELQQEWVWTERFPSQPEMLRYLDHVADRFDLRSSIRFETRVVAATFDDDSNLWNISTDRGDSITAQYCILAVGCLSSVSLPNIPGAADFLGEAYHTARWPEQGVDFTDRRVGVIGTGASGIQCIPIIAEQAHSLVVFQRTPNFSMPAGNVPLDPEVQREFKRNYAEHRRLARESPTGNLWQVERQPALSLPADERDRVYEERWAKGYTSFAYTFSDLLVDREANDTAAQFVHRKIRERVLDPDIAEKLLPRDHPIGTKRVPRDTNYYETFNRDNVTLVDIRATPIEEMTPSSIRTTDGTQYPLDCIVYATGFDAMTGAILNIDIRGRGGLSLRDKWNAGPRTYLGLSVAGFPNLFIITGPGSPSVLANMIVGVEQHVDWIADCISYASKNGHDLVEATTQAEDDWVDHVNEVARRTLFYEANSWYLGANVPGKPRVFMPYVGGFGSYRQRCLDVADNGYEGYVFDD